MRFRCKVQIGIVVQCAVQKYTDMRHDAKGLRHSSVSAAF